MAFGNPATELAAIEATYEDTAVILHEIAITGDDKITKEVPQEVYACVNCGLSYAGDSSNQTKAQQNINYDAVIFMSPQLTILPGYKISLKRFGRDNATSPIILHFEVIGQPSIYATHQQVKVRNGDLS